MRNNTLIALLGFAFLTNPASAQVRADVHLDKNQYLAGEPVFVVWEYGNIGSSDVPFDGFDPYCPEPGIRAPFAFAEPTVFPFPHDGLYDCEYLMTTLKPGVTHETKFLLNHRFDLSKPGTYDIVVSMGTGFSNSAHPSLPGALDGTKTLTLVLRPASEGALRRTYQPYFDVLNSDAYSQKREALRVLADSGAKFAETELLRFSSDPESGFDSQDLADEGLARLRTPAACARLAELADHPELHHQQTAIRQLGQCGDPGYMLFLFRLADRDSTMRQFAILAAGEVGGEAAVDRLLSLHLQNSAEWETKFYALARTGSKRAAKAIIDALPYLHDGTLQYAALRSLATLTHRESREKDFAAQSQEWKQWWATSPKKVIYKPRDWQVPVTPLNGVPQQSKGQLPKRILSR